MPTVFILYVYACYCIILMDGCVQDNVDQYYTNLFAMFYHYMYVRTYTSWYSQA